MYIILHTLIYRLFSLSLSLYIVNISYVQICSLYALHCYFFWVLVATFGNICRWMMLTRTMLVGRDLKTWLVWIPKAEECVQGREELSNPCDRLLGLIFFVDWIRFLWVFWSLLSTEKKKTKEFVREIGLGLNLLGLFIHVHLGSSWNLFQ